MPTGDLETEASKRLQIGEKAGKTVLRPKARHTGAMGVKKVNWTSAHRARREPKLRCEELSPWGRRLNERQSVKQEREG